MLTAGSLIQEVTVEASTIFQKFAKFTWVLDVSKVLVPFNCEGFLSRKSAERRISTDLMNFGKFHGSFWHDMTIIFNSVNSVVKTVKLSEIERNKTSVGVLFFS